MSERRDHGKNLSGKFRIELCAKSFILRVYDGLARLKLLRPTMSVIIMAAALDKTTYKKRVAKHQASFLRKPFTNAELLLKIKEVIEQRKKGLLGSL